MKIPYLKRPASPDFSSILAPEILKPQIKIALRHQDKKLSVFALIDSGADACLFPKGIADLLGINVREGPKINFLGIGGVTTPFYFHEIEILIDRFQIKTKAGFSMSENIGMSGILGQVGFFDQVIVSFDYKNGFIEIKKTNFIHDLASKLPF